MIRTISSAVFALVFAVPLAGQAPPGYQIRVDGSTNVEAPGNVPEVAVEEVDDGIRVETGPAVVLWNPANTATESYDLHGRFTLSEPSDHVEYYGLVFGGRNLAEPDQTYLYFLVAQDGSYLIKHRAGDATHDIVGRTPHEAVNGLEGEGTSVNDLNIRVRADHIHFEVNGTEVHNQPRTGMASNTDGIWGMRINHALPGVVVENLGISE